MSLESFKAFVREKPRLNDAVLKKESTWQDFYNMYELYGPSSNVWDRYLNTVNSDVPIGSLSVKDFFGIFKNMNMTDLQKGVGSLQKGVTYLQDLVKDKPLGNLRKSSYEPRPMHRFFDD